MKFVITILISIFTFNNTICGQSRILQGRIISYALEPLWDVRIQNADKITLGETDLEGRFKIELPNKDQILLLSGAGLEPTKITLGENCDTVEVIMMLSGTYDFMSSNKIDRLRLKKIKQLPELYLQAYNKGLFRKSTVCYSRQFEPKKPTLDSISKEIVKQQRKNKKTFDNLKIGDTIKIPFGTEYDFDGTQRTNLIDYSFLAYKLKYDCIIEVVITDKNQHNKGYNLICRVINCNLCKPESIYHGRPMKVGEVFEHNIKFSKILTE